MPCLLAPRRLRRCRGAEPGQPEAHLRVVGGALLRALERDAPPAPRGIGVRAREPRAEQSAGAVQQLSAIERPTRGARTVDKALAPERAMKRYGIA
jgi:hypothetical protein